MGIFVGCIAVLSSSAATFGLCMQFGVCPGHNLPPRSAYPCALCRARPQLEAAAEELARKAGAKQERDMTARAMSVVQGMNVQVGGGQRWGLGGRLPLLFLWSCPGPVPDMLTLALPCCPVWLLQLLLWGTACFVDANAQTP